MAKESRTRRPFAGLVLLSMALALTVYACGNAARVEQPRPQVHTLPVVVITAVTTARPFTEFQVDKPVSHKYGNAAPRYPDSLRATGIEGEVLAQFVVNANGHVEIASLKILNSPHELFVRAVQDALLQMRFHPAEVKGNRVRQLVQQPFEFGLAR